MSNNKVSRTSVVRCAAVAVLECFKTLNVRRGRQEERPVGVDRFMVTE